MTFEQLRIIRLRERQGSGPRRLAGRAESGPPPAGLEAVIEETSEGSRAPGVFNRSRRAWALSRLGRAWRHCARRLLALPFEASVWPLLLALADSPRVVHPYGMNARTPEPGPPIPCAPFDDLDLEKPEDESEWDRRVMALAAARIATERVRLERLGIIGADGELISSALPPDMLPESDTTLETG